MSLSMLLAALIALRRLGARRRGAVALEAMLSIMLMLGAFQVMWGASLIIFNQSKVRSGAQFAAHGAVTVYDRSTYRGGFPVPGAGSDGGAADKARQAAQSLLIENAQTGMAPDQYNGTKPTVTMTYFDIRCASAIGAMDAGTAGNCAPALSGQTSMADAAALAAVTRVEVQASASGKYWLLAPLGRADKNGPTEQREFGDGRKTSDERTGNLSGRAIAFSVSSEATP